MARSKFFNNSYTPTPEIKALRASEVSETLVVSVPKTNYLGNVTCTKPEYAEVINFLNNHFILPALTLSPGEMNPVWLSEFWYTCTHSVISGVSQLRGFIDNGTQPITITANTIRSILQLPAHDAYDPLPESDVAKGGIVNLTGIECKTTLDASGNRKYSTVFKTRMDGVWNALFTNFIQSLGTKAGSYDQFSSLEAQIYWSLVNSFKVDYASVIYNELVAKVTAPTRASYVPYPRFLSLIFKDQFDAYDIVSFEGFEPTLVGSQIFSKPATAVLPDFMKHPGILAPQPVTAVSPVPLAVLPPSSTTSLITPPVTTVGQPPVKKPPTAPKKKKSKLGSLKLKDQGHSKKKSSTDAKGELVTVRSVTEGTLAEPSAEPASLDSRKSSDSIKGQPQTAAVAQPTVSSVSGAPHTLRSSQPISHLSSSRKDDISDTGLVASAGDNTPIVDVTTLATDPGHLLSITAPAVNVSPQSHGEIQAAHSVSDDPLTRSQVDGEEAISMDTSADTHLQIPILHTEITTSPIRELTPTSFTSDNLQVTTADQTTPTDQAAQSKPTSPPKSSPTQSPPKHTSPPVTEKSPKPTSTTDQLLMEYIASSQTQIRMLTEDRESLKGDVSLLTDAVTSLAKAYNSIEPWSSSVSEKVQLLTQANLSISSSLHSLQNLVTGQTTHSRHTLNTQRDAIAELTSNQKALTSSITDYLEASHNVIKVIPQLTAEVTALRQENLEYFESIKEGVDLLVRNSQGESSDDEADPTTNTSHKEIVLKTYALRPIPEQPHLEELATADMDVTEDDDDELDPIDFPEFHPDELRMYDVLVKEWAADKEAKAEGSSVSFELARWEWMNKPADESEKDDTVMHDAGDDDGNDDDDNNNDGQGGGPGNNQEDKPADDDEDTDANMDDQEPISSILKRKRTSDSSPASEPSSKKTKVSPPHLNIVIPEVAEPSSASTQTLSPSAAVTPTPSTATPITPTQTQPPATASPTHSPTTATLTIPPPPTTTPPATPPPPPAITTATISSTSPTPLQILTSSSSTSLSLHTSSESTSSPLPDETKDQRIARKIKARQDRERELILKINEESEFREEMERKRLLQEQSDADRAYLLQLSSEDAAARERELKLKRDQEESDAAIAKILADLEQKELEQEQKEKSAEKSSKKKGLVAKTSVDKKWDEIDRKRYAERMSGRSNPAPITKVNLKKSKNQSQPQLLIHRGIEKQSMLLDQICKLHREEWNEIRLAISHSTSAAKAEVLKEIDRLFQKMVSLQLLRPEDTVIHGEEIVQPPSPRYRSGTSSIYRIPNTSRLNLSVPAGVPKVEGHEVTEGETGLVYRDLNGALRFQREAELEKVDQEQLIHLIRSASTLPKESKIRKAILDEALARKWRYLPSQDKYELEAELGIVKEEEIWKDK